MNAIGLKKHLLENYEVGDAVAQAIADKVAPLPLRRVKEILEAADVEVWLVNERILKTLLAEKMVIGEVEDWDDGDRSEE